MPEHRALLAAFAVSAALGAPNARTETAPVQPCPGVLVTPVNLDPHGDNNLSVRSSPRAGHEIDELFTGDVVCDSGRNGAWVHVQYIRDGRGITGWAYSGYLRAVTAAPAGHKAINRTGPCQASSGTDPNLRTCEPYEVKVDPPVCEIAIVERVYFSDKSCRIGSGEDWGIGRPQDGDASGCSAAGASGISYTNGNGQVGACAYVPAMENSRPGDHVRLCLVSFLADCPQGDDRGKTYAAENLRTHGRWRKPDASHMCGGA